MIRVTEFIILFKYHLVKLHPEMLKYLEKRERNIKQFYKSNEFKTLRDRCKIFSNVTISNNLIFSNVVTQWNPKTSDRKLL